MKRRLLSILLCLCMALTLLPTAALAADGTEVGTEAAFKTAWDANTGTVTLILTEDILLTDTLTAQQGCTYIVQGNGYVLNNVALTGAGSVTLNADLKNSGYAQNGITSALTVSGQVHVTVNGNVTSTGGNGIDMQASAHVTVNGDVTGGVPGNTLLPAGCGAAIRLLPQGEATGALTVSGTITGGSDAGTSRYGSALRYVNLSENALSWGDYPAEGVYSIGLCGDYETNAMNFIVDEYVKAAENAAKKSSADFAVLKDAVRWMAEQFGVSADPTDYDEYKDEDIVSWSEDAWEKFLEVDLADAVRQTISSIQSDNPYSFEQTAAFTEKMENALLTALGQTTDADKAKENFQQDVVVMRKKLLVVDVADAVRQMVVDVALKDTSGFPYLRELCLAFANLVQMPEEDRPTESKISAEIEKDTTDGTSFANWYVDEIIKYIENNTDKVTSDNWLRLSQLSESAFAASWAKMVNTTNHILQDWQAKQMQGVTLAGPAVTLENIIVSEGQTLTVTTGGELTNQGAVAVNGTLTLPSETTAAQIIAMNLTGSGLVKAGDKAYTTDGEPLHVYTTAMDFSKSADKGNWSATATLDNDGYTWDAATKTLTLKNFYLSTTEGDGGALILPESCEKLVLADGSVNAVTNTGNLGSGIIGLSKGELKISGNGSLEVSAFCWAVSQGEGSLNIAGGTLRATVTALSSNAMTANNITVSGGNVSVVGGEIGMFSLGNITVTGGVVTATSAEGNGIHANGDIVISGGRVHAVGGITAIWGENNITLDGMRITNPSGAAVGNSVNAQGGSGTNNKAIMLNGADVLDVTIEKTPSGGGGSSTTNTTTNTTTTKNPDGSTTVTNTTTKSDGTKETVATTTSTDGAKEAVTSTEKKQSDGSTVKTETTVTTDAKGNAAASGTVTTDSKTGAVTIPAKVIETLAKTEGATLTVETPNATLQLDNAALKALTKQGVKAPALVITPVPFEKLPEQAQKKLAGAAVFSLSVNGGGVDFGSGTVTVTLNYTRKAANTVVVVYYVDNNGNMTRMPGARYQNGKVTYKTNHFSLYAVTEEAMPFADVSADAYYADAVLWAVDKGVTSGTSATTFAPNATCTRAQTVTFLWRAMGSPEPTSVKNPFTDVKADAYYYKAVLWAVEKGITSGTSATTFNPGGICTRAQVMTFLWRAEGSPVVNYAMDFTDVPADSYYAEAVRWAVSAKITEGTGANTFSSISSCTRAQIVTFLFRQLGK